MSTIDDDTMPLTRWSSLIWTLFHIMAASFPKAASSVTPDVINSFNNWFIGTINNLPCETCREDAIRYERQNNFRRSLVDRLTVSRYMLDFHNYVNQKLGKPKWTIEMVAKHYQIPILPSSSIPISEGSRMLQKSKVQVQTTKVQAQTNVENKVETKVENKVENKIEAKAETSRAVAVAVAIKPPFIAQGKQAVQKPQQGIPGQFLRPLRFGQPPFQNLGKKP